MTRQEILETLSAAAEDDQLFYAALGEVFGQAAMANIPALSAVLGLAVSLAQAGGKTGTRRVLELLKRLPEEMDFNHLYVLLSIHYQNDDEHSYTLDGDPGYPVGIFFSEEEARAAELANDAMELSGLDLGRVNYEQLFTKKDEKYHGCYGDWQDRITVIKLIREAIGDPEWSPPEDPDDTYSFTLPDFEPEQLEALYKALRERRADPETHLDFWLPSFYRVATVEIPR